MDDRVKVTMLDGVADVRLVRGDKMNALDAAMFEALVATCERLAQEKGLRAVVFVRRRSGVLCRPRHGALRRNEGGGRKWAGGR